MTKVNLSERRQDCKLIEDKWIPFWVPEFNQLDFNNYSGNSQNLNKALIYLPTLRNAEINLKQGLFKLNGLIRTPHTKENKTYKYLGFRYKQTLGNKRLSVPYHNLVGFRIFNKGDLLLNKEYVIDHIVGHTQGGDTIDPNNLQILTVSENCSKASRLSKPENFVLNLKTNRYFKYEAGYKQESYEVIFTSKTALDYYLKHPVKLGCDNWIPVVRDTDQEKEERFFINKENPNLVKMVSSNGEKFRIGVGSSDNLRKNIKLSDNKRHMIYRLVYQSFHPNEDISSLVINHKDGNPLNNNLSNLEAITQKDNMRDQKTLERRMGVDSLKDICIIDLNNPYKILYKSKCRADIYDFIEGFEGKKAYNVSRIADFLEGLVYNINNEVRSYWMTLDKYTCFYLDDTENEEEKLRKVIEVFKENGKLQQLR